MLRTLAVIVSLSACATPGSSGDGLRPAVESYNGYLRWKKFESAATFLAPERRPAFLERYLASEDDLHVNSVEVRAVNWVETEVPTAHVTVMAQRYLLPSTVVEKVVMTQRWELHGGAWMMMHTSEELAPEITAAPTPEPTSEAPEP